jgi:hypothetical protein
MIITDDIGFTQWGPWNSV